MLGFIDFDTVDRRRRGSRGGLDSIPRRIRSISDGIFRYCSGGRENMTFVVKAGGRGDVSDTHLIWDVSRGANVTSPR